MLMLCYIMLQNASSFLMGIVTYRIVNKSSRTNNTLMLLGVIDNLSIHILRNLAGETHSNTDDFLRLQRWHVAEDSVGTAPLLATVQFGFGGMSTYLGLLKISLLITTNCATIHSRFKCGPYANRKSHNCRTSGSGGVHAHMVSTDAKA
jgi:hypothetical protein